MDYRLVAFDSPPPAPFLTITQQQQSSPPPSSPFEARYSSIVRTVSGGHPFVISFGFLFSFSLVFFFQSVFQENNAVDIKNTVATRTLCDDTLRVKKWLQCIIDDGGEGTILRRPSSIY